MTIPANSIIKSTILADLEAKGFKPNDAPDMSKFVESMIDGIINAVKMATVSTNVTVTSVSGVTTGPGVSGPGLGTGLGTIS